MSAPASRRKASTVKSSAPVTPAQFSLPACDWPKATRSRNDDADNEDGTATATRVFDTAGNWGDVGVIVGQFLVLKRMRRKGGAGAEEQSVIITRKKGVDGNHAVAAGAV